MKRWTKRLAYAAGIFLLLAVLAFVFRAPLLRAVGSYLIVEDPLEPADAIFVLGGNPFDRGAAGAQLFSEGWAAVVYSTGGSTPYNLDALQLDYTEAEVTRKRVIDSGVPARKAIALEAGTSTKEESELLLKLSQEQGFRTVIVVSDKFHTSRIKWVFGEAFEDAGIRLLVRGAGSTRYDENNWWTNEYGLIMVNNEYIKKLYYWLKY